MEKNEAREIVMEATRAACAEYDEMNGMTDGKFRQLCRVGGPVIESYLANRLLYVNEYLRQRIAPDVMVLAA